MIATHDDRIVKIAQSLAERSQSEPGSWEVQMLMGGRPGLARGLVDAGTQVRIYVAYGPQWYAWFVRRIAERPHNLALVVRALGPRKL